MLELAVSDHGAGSPGVSARLVNTWSDDAGIAFARAFVDGTRRWVDWPGLGAFEFSPGSPTVVLHCAPGTDRERATDIFVRIVQPVVLQAQGTETLHASAAEGPCGVIAFAGISGNGKSTLAWALGQRPGFRQISDDAVVLAGLDNRGESNGVAVFPLPYLPRLRHSAQQFLAPDAPPWRVPDDVPPGRPLLRAIVLLEQTSEGASTARPTRLTPAEAFPAVLTHAYCFDETDRDERERMVRHYLDIAATVPVFRLRYRPDFDALPELLDAIIAATADDAGIDRPSGHGR
jgi:hypothetical protein